MYLNTAKEWMKAIPDNLEWFHNELLSEENKMQECTYMLYNTILGKTWPIKSVYILYIYVLSRETI